MTMPALDEPITAVITPFLGWTPVPLCGRVTGIFMTVKPTFRWYGAVGVANNTVTELALREEGITWIRGHHMPESEEAQALLAAYTLVRP